MRDRSSDSTLVKVVTPQLSSSPLGSSNHMRLLLFISLLCPILSYSQTETYLANYTVFESPEIRKPCPYEHCDPPEETLWGGKAPQVWFLDEKGDSISIKNLRKSLPSPFKAYLLVSIDWDGTIWKARVLSKDTTNFYRVNFSDIAKRARATPWLVLDQSFSCTINVWLHNP